MKEYNEEFNLEELIGEMMQEIIILRSENNIIKEMIRLLYLKKAPEMNPEQFDEFYRQAIAQMSAELLSSHKWYEGYWKDKLSGLFP